MDHIFYEVLALTRAGLMDVPLETDISPEDWYAIIKIAGRNPYPHKGGIFSGYTS